MKNQLKRTPHLWAAIMAAILVFCGCEATVGNGADNGTEYNYPPPDDIISGEDTGHDGGTLCRAMVGGQCPPADADSEDALEDTTVACDTATTDEGVSVPEECQHLAWLQGVEWYCSGNAWEYCTSTVEYNDEKCLVNCKPVFYRFESGLTIAGPVDPKIEIPVLDIVITCTPTAK